MPFFIFYFLKGHTDFAVWMIKYNSERKGIKTKEFCKIFSNESPVSFSN